MSDTEAQIKADFASHPGSWRPDPENWFREGWLAGAGRARAELAARQCCPCPRHSHQCRAECHTDEGNAP